MDKIKIPEAPVIMNHSFTNKKGETLSLYEIIKNGKTIIGIEFSYLSLEKKACVKKIFLRFKKVQPSEKIFNLQSRGIKIYSGNEEVIVAFSSKKEYERLSDYYDDMNVYKSKINIWINCNNKFQFHFPVKNLKEIDWE